MRNCNDECVTSVLDILDLFDEKKSSSSVFSTSGYSRKVPFDVQRCLKVYESGLISNEGLHMIKNNPSNKWGRDIILDHLCVEYS